MKDDIPKLNKVSWIPDHKFKLPQLHLHRIVRKIRPLI